MSATVACSPSTLTILASIVSLTLSTPDIEYEYDQDGHNESLRKLDQRALLELASKYSVLETLLYRIGGTDGWLVSVRKQ